MELPLPSPPQLCLLGPPVLHWQGREWAFGPERRFQLLAWLAVQGDWVGRERAALLLWPDHDRAAARRNLRKLLFKLQDLPGLPPLDDARGALRWRVATDLQAFDAAIDAGATEQALALWRGEPCAGLDGDGAAGFADWLAAERARWQQRWRDALLHAARQAAEPRASLLWAERALALDPADEDALRLCLQAHAAAGAPAQARRLYAQFERQLQAQLNLAPSAATRALLQPPRAVHSGVLQTGVTTGFVGRRAELRDIVARLPQLAGRWLTVSGPGGIGKTRLVQQALPLLAAGFAHGAAWVPLDDLNDAGQIGARLAERLGLALSGATPALQQVQQTLQPQARLLVLDNLEHLPGAGPLLHGLLLACPALRVLATSRERLGIPGETVLALAGLPCPGSDEADDAEAFDAVQLFLQRAQAQQPARDPLADRAALVALCQWVDGLPLALELAAAWTRHFSVADILQDLRAGAELLTDAQDQHPARHHSLARVFEQAWARLAPAERDVLTALSVFQGGFTREAARAVAGASVPLLAALLDKSLLRADDANAAPGPAPSPPTRFSLHPLTQQFAAARLRPEQQAGAAHQRWFHALLARCPLNDRSRNASFLAAASADLPNLRLAWLGAVDDGRADLLAAGLVPLMRLHEFTGDWNDGVALLSAAAPLLQHAPVAAATLHYALATLDYRAGRYAQAQQRARQALPVLRRSGGPRLHKGTLNTLGLAAWQLGQLAVAAHCFAQALARARQDGDAEGMASFLNNAALVAKARGRYDDALAWMEQSLALDVQSRSHFDLATACNNLGNLYRTLGRHDEAISALQRGLAHLGPQRRGRHRGYLLCNLALAHFDAGQADRAEALALQAQEAVHHGGEPALLSSIHALLGRVALRQGDVDRARVLLASAARDARERGQQAALLAAAIHWAEWLQHSGRAAEADAVLAMALAHPGTSEPHRALARALARGGAPQPTATLDDCLAELLDTPAPR